MEEKVRERTDKCDKDVITHERNKDTWQKEARVYATEKTDGIKKKEWTKDREEGEMVKGSKKKRGGGEKITWKSNWNLRILSLMQFSGTKGVNFM